MCGTRQEGSCSPALGKAPAPTPRIKRMWQHLKKARRRRLSNGCVNINLNGIETDSIKTDRNVRERILIERLMHFSPVDSIAYQRSG